jgi:hypothetical protein
VRGLLRPLDDDGHPGALGRERREALRDPVFE